MSHKTEVPKTSSTIDALGPWFHNLHLPDGTQTAPNHFLGDFPREKWESFQSFIPEDLSGWSVLDIGCNAGFYSFQLANRGANVLGIDHDAHYLRQASWAAAQVGLSDQVRFEQKQIYDLARDESTFDLVWFMGVFYHLRYPLLGLDIVARKTRKLLVFQTMTSLNSEKVHVPSDIRLSERKLMSQPGWPSMSFIEHSLVGDPTNWWAPNEAGAEAMLRSSGFVIGAIASHEISICRPSDVQMRGGDLLNREYLSAIGAT